MKTMRIILSALAASFVAGHVAAQPNEPSRSDDNEVFRLDRTWLKPLTLPPVWQGPEISWGAHAKVSSPLISFLAAPRQMMNTPIYSPPRPEPIEQVTPLMSVNDVSPQKSRFILFRLSW